PVPAPPAQRPPAPTHRLAGASAALAGRLWWVTLLLAGLLCFVTFYAKGGLALESMTAAELVLTLAAGALVAGAVALARPVRHGPGLWSAGLLLALAAFTALSIVWSVAPQASWQDAG